MTLTTDLVVLAHLSNNYTDDSGNGNDGSAYGTPTVTSDKNSVANQAYNLTGSGTSSAGGNQIYFPCSINTNTDDFTISWWANYGTLKIGGYTILSLMSSGNTGFQLITGTSGSANAYLGSSGSNAAQVSITNDASFHHYVLVKSGTSYITYQDGIQIQSTTLTWTNVVATRLTLNGTYANTYGTNGTHTWDEIRLYSRALSSDEITALYEGYDNPVYPPVTAATDLGANDFGGF
jgi:hypothetical protein